MFAPECPSSIMPIRVGDKWSAGVLLSLADGPRRFSELRVPLRATPKVLTETLRAMERDGMITRTVYAEEHLPTVLAARAAYQEKVS
ncbi:helix-turn-helix transcriptional regulator [Antrihabitans cavernicola]|uniref:Helix-turn-helix transcriptional regulator n=2 Tax=Antrihabitans cavernicola TaxID=2495913 RepID=A0A5A7SB57_9NOCA|nr:helix-turn-helix transcriptional regulator [Spelaeibacter cavernicola]